MTKSLTIPVGATGGSNIGSGEKGSLQARLTAEDQKNFLEMKRKLEQAMKSPAFAKLASHVKFIQTREGLRIDLVDDADYSMFSLGTTQLVPAASDLIGMIAGSVKAMENPIMIRGHTDNLAYGNPLAMNNWMLSTGRAEATRRRLATGGLGEDRFKKLFPDAKSDELITWKAYRKDLFDEFKRTQSQDGSWSADSWTARMVGPVYVTACYLAIMQLDKGALPIYQR